MGGETAETMTRKKKKKKGRPSLLDLQKRALKQQHQHQHQHQHQLQKPNPKNPNNSLPNSFRRSARRNPNSSYAPEWVDEEDEDGDDEDDDERKQKKHKPLHGFNNPPPSNSSSGLNSNAASAANPGAAANLSRRSDKISAVGPGSDGDPMVEKVSKATDTLHGSLVEPGPTTPLPDKKLLVFILDRLQKKDTYGVFSDPVDPEELPDYHDIIEHPMDFSTVRKKLDSGAYANLEQFEKDVFLICSNAMQYNSTDTIYFRQARSMQEMAKKDFENLRQDSDDGEPQPQPQPQPKVVRRGRPPGKTKKPLERSPFDQVRPEFSSDASLATSGNNASLPNGYNLRKSTVPKYQPGDALARGSYGSHSNETYTAWSSEWENEFPASVVRAVLKYGKKSFVVDENKRDTYNLSTGSSHNPSVLTTFDGELKQLMAVGLSSEYGYARSLARFAGDLGPVAWKIASKKIQSVLPAGVEFGPGWVGENEEAKEHPSQSSDKHKLASNTVPDGPLSRTRPSAGSSLNSITTSCSALSREDMVETIGAAGCQNESASVNGIIGGAKPSLSVPMQRKPVLQSDRNGFSGGFGYNYSRQMVKARLGTPTGKSSLEHSAVPSQMLGPTSSDNSPISPMSGNDFASNRAKLPETSGAFLLSGNSSTVASSLDSQGLVSGLGGKSLQGMPPHHQQDFLAYTPDLNVGFLAPTSPSSEQHPDLALQL